MGRLGLVVAALVAALIAVVLVASTAHGLPTAEEPEAPFVLIGVDSLAWDDTTERTTPRLWELLDNNAAAAAISLRQIAGSSCPSDSWLSLSAGEQSTGPRDEGACTPLPVVDPAADESAVVSKWQELTDLQSTTDYSSELGRLGTTLTEHEVCATAVGPGAGLALADEQGTVDRYHADLRGDSFDCPLTVVDASANAEQATIDEQIGDVMELIPPDATVLIIGMSEQPYRELELGAALLVEPTKPAAPHYLVSPTTNWDGVIRLLDVTSTLTERAGIDVPDNFNGTPIRLGAERPRAESTTVQHLDDTTRRDRVLRSWSGTFGIWPGAAQLLVFGVALLVATRWPAPRWMGRGFVAVALFFAALPLAAYLVTLTKWWSRSEPGQALWLSMAVIAAGVAVTVSRLPRPALWWTGGMIAFLTTGTLVVDGVTGTTLHRGSLLGPSPILGGRFYGFGNTTFAVFIVAVLILAGAVAAELVAQNKPRAAGLAVFGIGFVALVVDVWPTWGADIGGGLSLLPGVVLLAFAVAGIRVTARRLAAAAQGGIAVVAVVGFLDWLRPAAQRTHAGRFVQDLLDGEAWEIIDRKAGYALGSMNSGAPAWITLAVLVVATLALAQPERFAPPHLRAAFDQWPTLRATLSSVLMSVVLGAVLNDYGIRIGTYALMTVLPLVALACAHAQYAHDSDSTILPSRTRVSPHAATGTTRHRRREGRSAEQPGRLLRR